MLLYYVTNYLKDSFKDAMYAVNKTGPYKVFNKYESALEFAHKGNYRFIYELSHPLDIENADKSLLEYESHDLMVLKRLSAFTTNRIIKVDKNVHIDMSMPLNSLLKAPDCTHLLLTTDYAKNNFPELYALRSATSGHKDNFVHTIMVLRNVMSMTNDIRLYYVALFHDLGKALVKKKSDKNAWSFHGHEIASSKMLKKLFNRYDIPKEYYTFVYNIVLYHGESRNVFTDIATDAAIRRFYKNLITGYHGDPMEIVNAFVLFTKSDLTTVNNTKKEKIIAQCNNFLIRLEKLLEEDKKAAYRPAVNGSDVMRLLGLPQGKEVGLIMKDIQEKIKSGEYLDEREFLLEKIKEYGKI